MTNISLNIMNTIKEESRQLRENCISSRKNKKTLKEGKVKEQLLKKEDEANVEDERLTRLSETAKDFCGQVTDDEDLEQVIKYMQQILLDRHEQTKEEMSEAANPENEEKNKIIRQALKGPKSMRKNREALKKMGITASDLNYDYDKYGDEDDLIYGSTVHLRGSNGKSLSVDPDGTNIWHTAGDSRDHYKKELNYKDRHSKHYTGTSNIDFNSERGKAFDYYNYLTKPENKYQDEVDKASKAKKYSDNEGKTGYNLPDEALTPEEKSLNKRPRKYVELKKDKEELEDKLAGYDETKKKLDKTNKDIKELHKK